jgi:hypothetical protein
MRIPKELLPKTFRSDVLLRTVLTFITAAGLIRLVDQELLRAPLQL